MAGVLHDGSTEKGDISQNEVLHDHDVLRGKNVTREDAMHLGTLTEEELMHEKKLRRLIDSMIMPLVMMVSQIKGIY